MFDSLVEVGHPQGQGLEGGVSELPFVGHFVEVPQRDDFEKVKFDDIFEKTASILSGMREECKVLRQERISSNANTKKPYPN